MATAAVGAEVALVDIVARMAGITCCTAEVAEVFAAMTGAARDTFVLTHQAEAGNCKVIESGFCPGRRAVTIRALGAVSPLVNIFRLMARDTGTSNIRKVVAHVTGIAGDICVCSAQGKPCTAVIEFRFTPDVGGVTRRAVAP